MRNAVAGSAVRQAPGLARYPIARLFYNSAQLLQHPVLTLPILVYLLGGSPGQIVWYAVIAGIATGLAAASATFVAALPTRARAVIAILLALETAGFLLATTVALGAGAFAEPTLLRLGALAYLLVAIPATMLARISEQGHEYRQAAAATARGVLPAIIGMAIAATIIWRLFFVGGMSPADMFARLLLSGAIFASAGAWLAAWPTLLALQVPHPARPMPTVRLPKMRTNRPLQRYSTFQAARGLAHFADPFLFVGVLTLIAPSIAWIGGAAIAYAIGEALARLIAIRAYGAFNVPVMFTISGTLHVITYIAVAFASEVLDTSLIADRASSEVWRDVLVIVAGASLGASHRFARTGHHAYVRSISSPATRDLSLTIIGLIMIVTAFAPLIAVRLLEAQELETLLQIGAGASIIGLLATAIVIPTYAPPRRPRGIWGQRR